MRLLVVLAIAGGTCLLAQAPVDYSGWLRQGIEQFQAGRYAAAVSSFERAASMENAKPVARLYLATSYMQQYVPGANSPENALLAQRAEEQFRRVLEMEPQNKVALASIASLNLNQKKWDEALGWYGKLIELDPSNADAYYTLGFVAWSKWYPVYSQARKDAGMKPQDPGPLPAAAVRQSLNAQYGPMLQAGIDALNKALEINPAYDDAMAYINLLIRERADLRDTVAENRQDVALADLWVEKALAAKKAKAEQRNSSANFAPPPPAPPRRIRIGGNVQQAKLITRIPPAATNFKGEVVLAVIIDDQGSVKEIKVMEGHPMLIPTSIEAVKHWKYQPTLLNGVPVEVETQITLTY